MRIISSLFLPALLTVGACLGIAPGARAQIVADGTREALYGAPLAVQTTPTGFGDATQGSQSLASGSELDASYAHIANGNLYLFLAGNLETNGNKLELFFDTGAGGQNVLTNTNADVDNNALNNLHGLTFDAGFTADYYLTLNATDAGGNVQLAAHFAPINGAGGVGTQLTAGLPGRNVALTFSASATGELGLDNSNIAGVTDLVLGAPGAVTTGIELAIPLSSLGLTVNSGDVRITAFINGQNHDFVSNQSLGGMPSGQANLGGDGVGNFTGDVAGVSFASIAGDQFFTVLNSTPGITLTPSPLTVGAAQVGSTPATGTLTISNPGTAALTVTGITSSSPVFTVAPTTLTVAAGGSATVTVTFTPSAVGAATATLTVVSNAASSPTTVTVTGTGTAAPVANISVAPNPLAVGSATVGSTPATATLTVRNPGTAPLNVTGIASSNPVFTVSPTTLTVAAGDSATLTVTFTPTTVGAATGTLTLTSNAPTSPTSVTVTGTGLAPLVAGITVTPDTLNAGTAMVGGAPAVSSLTVSNPGTAPLTISAVSSSSAAFVITPTTLTVAPGATSTLTVTFTPASAGAATATVTLTSNAPSSPTTVVVMATGTPAAVITVDGTRDTNYGTALAVQTAATGFGDANTGNQNTANGSELDGAYAHIDNGILYLLLTGNLETNGNKLELFFDTGAGGQNVVAAQNPAVDNGALGKFAGLTFDAGFAPEYYLTLNANNPTGGLTLDAHFAPLTGAAGTGTVLTSGAPGRTQTVSYGPATGVISLDNLNTAGVSGTAVGTPATVTTGVEFAIPLSVLGNPTGPIRISAMINGGGHDYLSNQVLAGLPTGTGNLGGDGAGNFTGDLAGINFNSFAGNQFFTVPNGAPAPALALSPTSLAFGTVATGSTGTRTLTIRNTGAAPLALTGIASSNAVFTAAPTTGTVAPGDSLRVTVTFAPTTTGVQTGTLTLTTNDPFSATATVSLTGTGAAPATPQIALSATSLSFGSVVTGATSTATLRIRNTGTAALTVTGITSSNGVFTAAPATGTVAPGDSLTVTVTFAPTAVGAQTGTLSIVSNDPTTATVTVTLTGTGIAPTVVNVDGTRDPVYGSALAVQTTATGFGDANQGQQGATNGSELDAAYAHIDNGTLYLLLTGNLETNGNRLDLFFDTQGGGQTTLAANNPDVDNNGLNRMAGLRFDNGFAADYFLTLNAQNSGGIQLSSGFGPVNGGGGTGTVLATNMPGTSTPLAFSASLTGQLTINNANTGGVTGTAVGQPDTVRTGIELAIPLAALGNPTGPFRISALINNQGHDFLSNQVLGGLPNGTANLGNPTAVNFSSLAGDQFFTVPNGTAAPALAVSTNILQFGTTVVGTPVTRRLTLRNIGLAPLTVSGITSSDPAFTAAPLTGTIAAGDTLGVVVTFTPTAAGTTSGTLTIASNDPQQPTATVGLTGNATSAPTATIQTSVTNLTFGAVNVGANTSVAFRIRNTGTAPLVISGITATNAAFTVLPISGTIAAGDSAVFMVTFAPTTGGAYVDSLLIVSNDPALPTAIVLLNGTGVPPAIITVDGTRDPGTVYGTALAVQTTGTGFGDATQGSQTLASGSELDAAYARIDNGVLYLMLTGNLESNGNKLEIFLDTQTGGQNQLLNTNPDVDGNALDQMAGMTFDAGFAPEYYLTMNATNPAGGFQTAASFAPVNGAGGLGTQLAAGPGRTQALDFGGGLTGLLALDNSNVAGVNATTVGNPGAVTTGIEWAIPLAALGNPTGDIRVTAFINGTQHDFVSNQVLAGLPLGTANLGGPATVNFGTPAGNQFFVIPNGSAPAPAVSLSTTSVAFGNVTVGNSGQQTLTITNTGTAPLTIASIAASLPGYTVAPTTGTIAPGGTLTITITLTPTAAGVQNGTLTITSNDPNQPTVTVALTGTGVIASTRVLVLSNASLNLGTVSVGANGTATVAARNTGNTPLTISGVTSSNGVFTAAPTLATVAPGDSLVITVTFTPTTSGLQTGMLTIISDATAQPTGTTVSLTGNGVLGLAGSLADARLSVYPNPSTGAFRVEWTGAQALRADAVLLDAVGRVVRHLPAAGTFGFAVEGVPAGVYTVRLLTEAGPRAQRVVVR